jgi:serine/threonine-protein kinase
VISQTPAAGSSAKKGSKVAIVVSGGPSSAPLINVAGLSASKAASELTKAGYKTTTKTESSKTVEAEMVIGTEPPAEAEVQEGTQVTLLVSSGPAPVRVPDVTGQSLEAAEATLTNAELARGTLTRRVSSTQTPGTVLAQAPTAGASVHVGEKVNLTVAQAPKEIAVPEVVGAAEAAAATHLKDAGFTPKTVTATTSEPSQVGVVLKQSPTGGAKARKGTTVIITVGALSTPTTPTTPTTTTTTTTTTTATPPPASE